MKKIFLPLVFSMLIGLGLFSCRKTEKLDDSTLPFLGGDTWVQSEIDQWIGQNLTTPYNMQVKYKFDQFEADVQRTLVPVREELMIPSLQAMIDVFIQPYVEVRSADFMKAHVPKEVVYVGSPSYNTNGTITLGVAEGGKKILLLDMNTFSLRDKDRFVEMMHTMHHEFGHILNQKVPYSPDFQLISKSDYDGNWNQISETQARSKGFVTPYAMSADTEDFVEIVSTMLAEGKEYYENLVTSQPADIQVIFRKKEKIVVDYYKNIWGVDLYKLQSTVQKAIEEYFPVSRNLPNASVNVDAFSSIDLYSAESQTSSRFVKDYNQAQTNMQNAGRVISQVRVSLFKPDSVSLLLGASSIVAAYEYPYVGMSSNNNTINIITFGKVYTTRAKVSSERVNAKVSTTQIQPLLGFCNERTLTAIWKGSTSLVGATTGLIGGGMYLITARNTNLIGNV